MYMMDIEKEWEIGWNIAPKAKENSSDQCYCRDVEIVKYFCVF